MEIILTLALSAALTLWYFDHRKSVKSIRELTGKVSHLKFSYESEMTYLQMKYKNLEKENLDSNVNVKVTEAETKAKEIIRRAERAAARLITHTQKNMVSAEKSKSLQSNNSEKKSKQKSSIVTLRKNKSLI